ncbi:MAG: hypothetical protein IIW86_03060 [Clostridia bacterium]|nr:hypothetical protein [Clostridia bacterium]
MDDKKIDGLMLHLSDYFRELHFSAEEMLIGLITAVVTVFWVVTKPDENGSKRERIVEMITDFVNAALDEKEEQEKRKLNS